MNLMLKGLVATTALLVAVPASAVSFVNGTTVSLDSKDDFSWTATFQGTAAPSIPSALGTITFNFLSANTAGTSWNFSYEVDNTSIAPSRNSRLGAFGFNAAPVARGVTFVKADRFDAAINAAGLFVNANRNVCFYSGNNCNDASRGVSVFEVPVKGTFTLATLETKTLVLSNFAARWSGAASNNNTVTSGAALTITPVAGAPVAPVPEPATWAMMLVGFGMMGASMRYRRKSTAASFA